MRIGIVGNCQAKELTACLRRHYPEMDIRGYFIGAADDDARYLKEAGDLDIVVSQWVGEQSRFSSSASTKHLPKQLLILPNLTFTGFHPDITYLRSNGALFNSPIGAYHSKIIASAFLAGIHPDRVPRLFNYYVYQALGYFHEFEKSTSRFNATFSKYKYSLSTRDFGGRVFMHTINHATGHAISLLGRSVAERLGLQVDDWCTAEDEASDGLLRDTVWPVYPEIAKNAGVEGSLLFKPHVRLMKLDNERLDIQTFVNRSYESYSKRSIDPTPLRDVSQALQNITSPIYA